MMSSVEVLYHFTCEKCKNWWSVATTRYVNQTIPKWNSTNMWCPHCGYKHTKEELPYELFQQ